MNSRIMFHVVAGYPTINTCLKIMREMDLAGAEAIEVQIPFSDPIADGETIIQANDLALQNGMTTQSSFNLIQKSKAQGLNANVYIMSYLQKVHHFGLDAFCRRSSECGVKGLIIPDLPYDSLEFSVIHALTLKYGLQLIPVLSPGMPSKRLQAILTIDGGLLYVTSQRGITGNKYSDTKQLKELISDIRQKSDSKIMIGFGISSKADVQNALKLADMAVVGSAVIKELRNSNVDKTLDYVRSLINKKPANYTVL